MENNDLLYENNYHKYLSYFTKDIIEQLKQEIIKIFKDTEINELSDIMVVNNIISTNGYYTALHNTLNKYSFAKDFFEWYDALEWYNSDHFDGKIQKLIVKSFTLYHK